MPECLPSEGALAEIMREAGALAWGVARAEPVDADAWQLRQQWLSSGCHASMDYLDRYPEVRRDPRLLLDGAQCIVVAAFNYYPARRQPSAAPQFAWYAYGRDYHEAIRSRLVRAAERIHALFEPCGANGSVAECCRVCVDTAPLMERYWAVKAGVGFIGRNAQLIVPGHGSACFLGEIVTTFDLPLSAPCAATCPDGCDRCRRACPGQALTELGSTVRAAVVDARRCLSYLTIEHRGPLPERAPRLGRRVYGCDACQAACPLNDAAIPTALPEFMPLPQLLSLTDGDIANLTQREFSALFRHSAVRRARLDGLLRNLAALDTGPSVG